MTQFVTAHVKYMPQILTPGTLYVSEEFSTAAHLCPCGCYTKIRTPLGPTEWAFSETESGPSLYPSIGNWQIPCQSHYFITEGNVIWAKAWTPQMIEAGRISEQTRRERYFEEQYAHRRTIQGRLLSWVKRLFGRS
jgi:hypothetical protein